MTTQLTSYLAGRWQQGQGQGNTLMNPSTEEPVAQTSTQGIDFKEAVEFARAGGAGLRELTFKQRAELLRALAKQVSDAREELMGLGLSNAGNTRSDAKFDIDGAAATLNAYAELGMS